MGDLKMNYRLFSVPLKETVLHDLPLWVSQGCESALDEVVALSRAENGGRLAQAPSSDVVSCFLRWSGGWILA
jgi:hypothetical protein